MVVVVDGRSQNDTARERADLAIRYFRRSQRSTTHAPSQDPRLHPAQTDNCTHAERRATTKNQQDRCTTQLFTPKRTTDKPHCYEPLPSVIWYAAAVAAAPFLVRSNVQLTAINKNQQAVFAITVVCQPCDSYYEAENE